MREVEISPTLSARKPLRQLVLTSTSVLLATTGTDPSRPEACRELLLVEHLDGEARLVPIPSTLLDSRCDEMVRLSATRVALSTNFALLLVDDIGGANRVTRISFPLYGLSALDADTLVGVNLNSELVVLSHVAETPVAVTTTLPSTPGWTRALDRHRFLVQLSSATGQQVAVFQPASDGTLPPPGLLDTGFPRTDYVVLSPDSFLVGTENGGGDESVYLFTDVGGTNQRSVLATPNLPVDYGYETHHEQPVRMSSTRALIGSSSDHVTLLADLGAANRQIEIPLEGYLERSPGVLYGSKLTRLTASRAAVQTQPGGVDAVAVIDDLGRSNRVTTTPTFFFPANVLGLGPAATLILGTYGLIALDVSSGAPTLTTALLPQPYSSLEDDGLLGNGRAVRSDWAPLFGRPDRPHHLQVIEGLPGGIVLDADRVLIRRDRAAGTSVVAAARLLLPEPSDFAAADLTVRVGEASQTLPRERLLATRKGYVYRDPTGADGFLRLVRYDADRGTLRIEGIGFATGLSRTPPDRIVLSLDSLFLSAAQSLDGEKRAGAIAFRR